MIQEIPKGNSLLVKGPTRVELLKGQIEVFGKPITAKKGATDNVLIVPSANNYPLFAVTNAKLEIFTANKDNLELIEENTIINEWIKLKDSLLKEIQKEGNKPLKIMVLGISSGKTSIIKYLANNFIREGLKVGYLDSDLGQQIMHLPTTLSIGEIKDYVVSSADIEAEETIFIGSTYPKGSYKFICSHFCNNLIKNYEETHEDTDVILIDSDGWIKTEAGIIYKNFFIDTLNPDVLVIFHDEEIEELKEIEDNAAKVKKRKIILLNEKNKYFYEKGKEERRFMRQSQFAKVLESFRKISIPLDGIQFYKTEYDKENDTIIEREINIRELVKLPYHYVIISLMTEDSRMINIGLLFVINLEKGYILLFSDLNFKEQKLVKKILLGSLRLSIKGNHQGYLYL